MSVYKPFAYSKFCECAQDARGLMDALQPLIKGLVRFPMRGLNRDCTEKDYRYESVVEKKFKSGECNLFSLCQSPDDYLERGRRSFFGDYLAYVFWILSRNVQEELLIELWSKEIVESCLRYGLATRSDSSDDRTIAPRVRLVPFKENIFITDIYERETGAMVYLSYDSLVFSELILEYGLTGKTICDLFSGSGIIGIIAAGLQKTENQEIGASIDGVDINSRAIACSQVNSLLADVPFRGYERGYARAESLVQNAALVLFNPPFIFGPESGGYLDSDGGEMGIQHTLAVLQMIHQRSHTGGCFAAITQTPIVKGWDLLQAQLGKFDRLEINYAVLDEFGPSKALADWYHKHKVEGFRQIFIHGRKSSSGCLKTFEVPGTYCFS